MRFLSVLMILALSPPAFAETSQLVGVWKLLTYERKDLETGKVEKTQGETPVGYLTYTGGGHYSLVMFGSGRPIPAGEVPTPEEALRLFKTTIAGYAGTYKLEGNAVIHHVEVAWAPALVGTDQVRYFTVDGNSLTIETAPGKSVSDGKMTVRYLKLQRVE
jgi:hypothetical protein